MSSTVSNPTILIVPGSFSPPWAYEALKSSLSTLGLDTVIVDLPSVGRRDPKPAATFEDDAAEIHAVAADLVSQGKEVAVVMHSYGGLPGTEGVKGLLKSDLEKQGKAGGIIRLIYLATFMAAPGTALTDLMGGGLPDFLHVDGDYMYHEIEKSAPINFSDFPYEKALELAGKFPQHSYISFSGRLSYPAYKYAPVSFLLTSEDKCIPPEAQWATIERAEKEDGVKASVQILPTGHCPNFSAPELVAKEIAKAIGL